MRVILRAGERALSREERSSISETVKRAFGPLVRCIDSVVVRGASLDEPPVRCSVIVFLESGGGFAAVEFGPALASALDRALSTTTATVLHGMANGSEPGRFVLGVVDGQAGARS